MVGQPVNGADGLLGLLKRAREQKVEKKAEPQE
jgi:hypothetical protein